MQKVSATEEAKLLLSSGNNQLAEEIKDHLKVEKKCVLCEVLTEIQIWLCYSQFCCKLITYHRGTK